MCICIYIYIRLHFVINDVYIHIYSVEEILSEAVLKSLKASSCKMHACGREDIDVRCLGMCYK
jgi:tRNA U54 and U55 pseudouridine synthase Pus10